MQKKRWIHKILLKSCNRLSFRICNSISQRYCKFQAVCSILLFIRGYSSSGRAAGSQSAGGRFEPDYLHEAPFPGAFLFNPKDDFRYQKKKNTQNTGSWNRALSSETDIVRLRSSDCLLYVHLTNRTKVRFVLAPFFRRPP